MYADYPPCATAPRWHAVGVVAFVAAGVCARARGSAAAPPPTARARVIGGAGVSPVFTLNAAPSSMRL